MDPLVGSALISAGSNLIGSLIGGKKQDSVAQQSNDANYGAIVGKMKAAERYGISKLYALGASPVSSPGISVGGGSPGLGETIAAMGGDISRAVAAGQTQAERELQALTLQKAALENDYLRAQITSVNSRTLRESAPALPAARPNINLPAWPGNRLSIQPEPGTSSAQQVQDEYGDIIENVYGLWHAGTDVARNFYNWVASQNRGPNRRPRTPQYWNSWDTYSGG